MYIVNSDEGKVPADSVESPEAPGLVTENVRGWTTNAVDRIDEVATERREEDGTDIAASYKICDIVVVPVVRD